LLRVFALYSQKTGHFRAKSGILLTFVQKYGTFGDILGHFINLCSIQLTVFDIP